MPFLDIETQFESAAKVFLETATGLPSSSFYGSLDQSLFVTPRVQISAELGGAQDPPTEVGDDNRLEYTQYELSLSIVVVSDASISNSQIDHRFYREKIREAMLLNSSNWTTLDGESTILPYYEVKYMRPSGTDLETDGDIIASNLSYDIRFTINPSSFV